MHADLVADGDRPVATPQLIRTPAGEPIATLVADAEIRLIGVHAVGQKTLRLDQSRAPDQARRLTSRTWA